MYSQSLSFVFITFLRSFSKLYQAKKSQEQALMESSEDNKMESILSQLVPRLGACCASDTVKDSKKSNKSSAGLIDFFSSEQCNVSERKPSSFPLLSLDHTNLAGHKRKSKNEVQGQVSNLLLRPVTIDLENEKEFLEEIPGLMLENLYASLDVLVDARINVYSKVLRSHGLALAKCNDAANCSSSGVMAVEYKLETLLEIGTNLSSDSVETKFSVQPNSKATTSDENRLELTIPILLEAFVKDLNIPIPDVAEKAKLPLTFNAPGTITGIFDQNLQELLSVSVDVDCDTLLLNMVEQATEVVSRVVELTNDAWSRNLRLVEVVDEPQPSADDTQCLTKKPVVTPELGPLFDVPDKKEILHLDLDRAHPAVRETYHARDDVESESESMNSFEKATNIVDYIFGEIDDMIIAPIARKKQRLLNSSPVEALKE